MGPAVIPGAVTAENALRLSLTPKTCLGCGCVLDIWGNYPRDYHSPWCAYTRGDHG